MYHSDIFLRNVRVVVPSNFTNVCCTEDYSGVSQQQETQFSFNLDATVDFGAAAQAAMLTT